MAPTAGTMPAPARHRQRTRAYSTEDAMEKPTWWTPASSGAWERVKEALRRDWEQTKHDLHVGGHERNQRLSDTVAQAAGQKPIPPDDRANAHVIARWEDIEVPIGFGYAAYHHYGDRYPTWTPELERALKSDWKDSAVPWHRIKMYVRHGYELPR
jgi:hypothetical protein